MENNVSMPFVRIVRGVERRAHEAGADVTRAQTENIIAKHCNPH